MTREEIENQIVLGKKNLKEELKSFFQEHSFRRIFLVAGSSFPKLPIGEELQELFSELGISFYHFSDFRPNPRLEEVEEGIKAFSDFQGDVIFAVGGGSALDTAKCIKLFTGLSKEKSYLEQKFRENDIPLVVHPTTAGTGSESTPFAVIYQDGEKCSVEHESIYPKYRIEDARSLRSLPMYQKKVTLLDALSHAMEAIWSKYSNEDSRAYGQKAISLILTNYKAYLSLENKNDAKVQGKASSAEGPSQPVLEVIAEAANFAGKAIAVTKTTAGHALSYKLGSIYQLPHGLATAMVNRALYPFMCREKSRMIHPENLLFLAKCFLAETEEEGAKRYREILEDLEIIPTLSVKAGDLENLVAAVNPERLSNHPIALREEDIRLLYKEILGGK